MSLQAEGPPISAAPDRETAATFALQLTKAKASLDENKQ